MFPEKHLEETVKFTEQQFTDQKFTTIVFYIVTKMLHTTFKDSRWQEKVYNIPENFFKNFLTGKT